VCNEVDKTIDHVAVDLEKSAGCYSISCAGSFVRQFLRADGGQRARSLIGVVVFLVCAVRALDESGDADDVGKRCPEKL